MLAHFLRIQGAIDEERVRFAYNICCGIVYITICLDCQRTNPHP